MVAFDVNLSTGRWPFRPYRLQTMGLLVPHLAQYGIIGGLVRSSQAAFSSDLLHENYELAEACQPYDGFRALPVVHPDYGFWRDIQAQAVLLLPFFQNYSLLDGKTLDMARAMAKKGHVFVISLREEDERAQHPLCQVKAPTADIQAFAEAVPETPVIVLNAYFGECCNWSAGNVYFDIAFYEPFNITESLLAAPKGRVLFGSHAPFFVASAALSKLQDGMPEADAQAIARDNALAILRA
jgi:predicted TIM-barrel fold metal-dependent hydrolase